MRGYRTSGSRCTWINKDFFAMQSRGRLLFSDGSLYYETLLADGQSRLMGVLCEIFARYFDVI